MSGFDKDAVAFLKALRKTNTRDWFQANKKRYEAAIKQPAEAFSAEMAAHLETLTGRSHTPKIFRIYRDVRFSKDKTPYNTHVRISFTPADAGGTPPGWFFGLETDHVVIGTGVFGYEKGALDAWRERVAGADGEALAKALGKLEASGARLSEPDLKRVPKPYEADHPREALLRRKGLAVWIDYPDAAPAFGNAAVKTCGRGYKRLLPVFEWLLETA